MRFTLVAARKDLRRLLADPLALVLWLGIPLLLGGLLSLVAGRQAPAPRVHLLVADRDDSFLSNALTSSSRWGDLLELERVGLEAGRARLDEGEASALLLIPAGFQDAVLGVEATRLGLWTNPAQRILPRIIQEGLEILIEVVHYAQLLFGDALAEARTVAREGELVSAEGLARVAPLLGAPLERGRNLLAAPPLSVRTAAPETEPARPPTGFGMLFLPGILFMSLVFVAQGLSDDLWRERELGTFRRFLAAPHGLAPVLGGKLLTGLATMAGVSILGLGVGVVAFGLEASRTPLALAWCAITGTALYCYFLLMQLLATSARGGTLVTNAVMFPLIMAGGSFFPFEAMPEWMARIGRWTPNGQAVVQLKHLLAGTAVPADLLTAFAAIGASAALAFVVVARELPKRVSS